jgi:hypothetical protein
MRKSLFKIIAATIVLTANVFLIQYAGAQSPEKMSYQIVIRNNDDKLVKGQALGMQISILKDSASGTPVYVETQISNTNENGLISIEIGGGTFVSGNFEAIDWAGSSFYIKTEIDPEGGNAYTITRTCQLLSVPYALHSKKTDSLIVAKVETDPVFASSPAGGISNSDTANWNNKQNTVSAGTGIAINNDVISAATYAIGDLAQGGVVFWVDESGKHGLVCALEDFSEHINWSAGSNMYTMARGDGPLSGEMNTTIIIARLGYRNNLLYAARLCAELQITLNEKVYTDWYLPSKDELHQMYLNKNAIDATATTNSGVALATDTYWSSTEVSNSEAWVLNFSDGTTTENDKVYSYSVRAIRSF